MPKFIECLVKSKIKNEKFNNSTFKSFVLIMLLCGVVGLAHSRNQFNKGEKDDSKIKFSSLFSSLWE